jgi:hypothetical protein
VPSSFAQASLINAALRVRKGGNLGVRNLYRAIIRHLTEVAGTGRIIALSADPDCRKNVEALAAAAVRPDLLEDFPAADGAFAYACGRNVGLVTSPVALPSVPRCQ